MTLGFDEEDALIEADIPEAPPPPMPPETAVRRLLFAVLEDALRTIQLPDPPTTAWKASTHYENWLKRRATWKREARAWFCSDAQDSPFTFVSICHIFALDAARIRMELYEHGWLRVDPHTKQAA